MNEILRMKGLIPPLQHDHFTKNNANYTTVCITNGFEYL